MRKIGSNQYQYKYGLSKDAIISVWMVATITLLGVIVLPKSRIISPIPDGGSNSHFIKTVYAKENLTPEEELLIAGKRMFGYEEVEPLRKIIQRESGFNNFAVNPSSGACGLFQALPCKKMKCELGDVTCQIKWGLSYIKSRYGTPSKAWEFWQEHHWY